ncbi:MAG: biopolymer transporter ExbD [Candidatus Kuenenia sp.]|nr:biopolymer transporter ExbD [Candidatus Kuenenia hertensis]
MKLSTGFEKKKARIEMIPLIDIVFLLLVFFIYAMLSMTIQRGINVNVPQAHTGTVHHEDYLSISINSENEIFLNKEKVEISELPRKVKERREQIPDQKIFVNGDEKANLGTAIEVLDVLQAHGIEEIHFVTKKKP